VTSVDYPAANSGKRLTVGGGICVICGSPF
jgi:hypothetical protein